METNKKIVEEVSRKRNDETISDVETNTQHSLSRIEENLQVGKKEIEEGKYFIKKTIVEEDIAQEVTLYHEHVTFERKEINKYIDTIPEVRNENGTMIIPVVKEVVVVEKKLFLVEEIHVIKNTQEEKVNVSETLKKEQVEITKQVNQ